MEPEELKFYYLDHLIRVEGIHEGVLATAIEKVGVFGYDRYGRFNRYGHESLPGKRALDALAAQFESCQFPGDEQAIDSGEWAETFCRFGWPIDQRPDFDSLSRSDLKAPPRRVVHPGRMKEDSDLRIIFALLEFIKGGLGNSKHPDFTSEAALIRHVSDKMAGYKGCTQRTLEQRFALAKRVIGDS